jgi:non-specific protein-tyrosine kinase
MMKYQKAVEKVKQERMDADSALSVVAGKAGGPEPAPAEKLSSGVPTGAQNVPGTNSAAMRTSGEASADDSAAGTEGSMRTIRQDDRWMSPIYTQSRRVHLDNSIALRNRICLQSDAPELDYYKVLRTQLMQRMKPMGWNMVMITSVRPGEGKSLTSINLALVFAKTFNHTVLLMDCDLHQQGICRYLGITGEKGIVDFLTDSRELKDLIIWPGIEKMTLISGGSVTTDTAELLGSPRMRELMKELKGRFEDRFIIVDAPPILSGADTMALAQLVDAILVVVESGRTQLKDIQNAMELIPKEKFLGFVLNKHAGTGNGYYSRYYGRKSGGK